MSIAQSVRDRLAFMRGNILVLTITRTLGMFSRGMVFPYQSLYILALGAQGVIIGTRLLTTREAPLHNTLKKALLNASELDTMLIMRSIGSTHRVWINAAAEKCAELEASKAELGGILKVVSGKKAKQMYDHGNLGEGIIPCGQGVGMVHDMPTVQELFDRMMKEAEEAVKNL